MLASSRLHTSEWFSLSLLCSFCAVTGSGTRTGRLGAFSEDDFPLQEEQYDFKLPTLEEAGNVDRLITRGGKHPRHPIYDAEGNEVKVKAAPVWNSDAHALSIMAGSNPLSPMPGFSLIGSQSYLATAKSIFALTSDEERVEEVRNAVIQLHRAYNILREEKRKKHTKLIDLNRAASFRDDADDYTVSLTNAGEHMIDALSLRLEKVTAASAKVDRLGSAYGKITALCVKNPPYDESHLQALQEQVALAEQQTQDLVSRAQSLLLQQQDIQRHGTNRLRSHLQRIKVVRNEIQRSTDNIREQIKNDLLSERRSLTLAMEERDANSTTTGRNSERKRPSVMHNVTSYGQGASFARSPSSSSLLADDLYLEEDMEVCNRQRSFSIAEGVEEGSDDQSGNEAIVWHACTGNVVDSIRQLEVFMGANGMDDLVQQCIEQVERQANLQKQSEKSQSLAEKLRHELEVDQALLNQIRVSDEGGVAEESSDFQIKREDGYDLDNQVFNANIRLSQIMRKARKVETTLQELKTGLRHLGHLIAPVEAATGRVEVAKALLECEDPVALLDKCEASLERMIIELAAPLGGSRIKMRESMPDFWQSGFSPVRGVPRRSHVAELETPGGASAIDRNYIKMQYGRGIDGDGKGMEIRVSPSRTRDAQFERSMHDLRRQQDQAQAMIEAEATNYDSQARQSGMARFLGKALTTSDSMKHLRRANMLVKGKQGKHAGFGLLMDDVLKHADIDIASAAGRKAQMQWEQPRAPKALLGKTDIASHVHSRPELKNSTNILLAKRRAEERRQAMHIKAQASASDR
ncbi:unnamed protein product [Chrysoparadoxa australica]